MIFALLLPLLRLVSPSSAATDLSTASSPLAIQRVACDATAGNLEEVTLPEWARRVVITFLQSDAATADTGKVALSGTDGAAIGTDFFPVGSGGAFEFQIAPGRSRVDGGELLYLACGTNSAFAYVLIEA